MVPSPELTERFYAELREIAQRLFAAERPGHTLQPTALVNEACLRLLTTAGIPEGSRAHRLALAGRVLRQVLIDHARTAHAVKRGGNRLRIELDPATLVSPDREVDFLTVHEALEKLRELHERQAEVVLLRLFGGLTIQQVATELGVSGRTIEDDWAVARAWLRRELGTQDEGTDP